MVSGTEKIGGIDSSAADMKSEILSFYNGTTIFLTGATGFMGNLILEKILRTCSGVKKIYILIREKKGKSSEQRFNELFNDVVFEVMKKEVPDYLEKISLMIGDCSLPNLGIGEQYREVLENEVNIVIHSAATVRFDEHLRKAVNINITALRYMLTLCKHMRKLKSFVYISTAFSNCGGRKIIDEIFYKPPICGDEIVQLINVLNDEYIERITPSLLKDFPNTYTMTKAIAEYEIFTHGKGLPIGIIRPSMIISTEKEPIPGWINNYYGPTGVCAAAGIGLMRVMRCKIDEIAEIVPGDYVSNAVLACAWDVHNKWNEHNAKNTIKDDCCSSDTNNFSPVIYNYVSSNMNPVTWKEFNYGNKHYGRMIPSARTLWPIMLRVTPYKYEFLILSFLLHILPAYIIDFITKIMGKKPQLVDSYRKLHIFADVTAYFGMRSWKFGEANTRSLLSKMSEVDRSLFQFDMTGFEWPDYWPYYTRGIRLYIYKDPMETLPEGIKILKKLTMAYYTLLAFLVLVILMIIYIIFLLITFFATLRI